MAHIREIKGRLKSVKNIHKITQAMKVVASARLKKAQERILGARPYAFRLADLIHDLAVRVDPEAHPLFVSRPGGKTALLVVTADRGLCGSFNANILRRTQAYLKENPSITLMMAGRKGRDFFKRRGVPIHRDWINLFPAVAYENVKKIADEAVRLIVAEKYERVDVLYNEFKSVIQQKVTLETLLPLRPENLRDDTSTDFSKGEFLFEPSMDALIDELLPKYVAIEIHRILLESFSSEMGARRNAMEAATKNATEMIAMLTLAFNRARQAGITKEIAEIVGGAEALK
jgi:F-type H+-transporting ATPase subunit gamma